jgi:hypothetical protein
LLDGWWRAPQLAPFKEELKQLVTTTFGGKPVWGWKDPRASVLLPLWREVLGELGIEMRVIIPFRNPLDVAASVSRVFNLPAQQTWRLWLYSMLAIRSAVDGIPHLYVDYNTLLENPRAEGERLREFIGARAPIDLPERIAGIIRPALRHSEHEIAKIEAAAGPDIAALYLECLGRPPQISGHRMIRTLADYLTAVKLCNLQRADTSPTFQSSAVYADYDSLEASKRRILSVERLIPYTEDHHFDETYELREPNALRLHFQPSSKALTRCRIDLVELDGVPLPNPVRSSSAHWQLDGWDIFPPMELAFYELGGDPRQVRKVRICGMLETVVAGTPGVDQEWVRKALAALIDETMTPKTPKAKK